LGGIVEGGVDATGDVEIGDEAKVNASVAGRDVSIHGHVSGKVIARKRLVVGKSGSLTGDVRVARLVIQDGASFSGNVSMGPATAVAAPEPPAPSAQDGRGASVDGNAKAEEVKAAPLEAIASAPEVKAKALEVTPKAPDVVAKAPAIRARAPELKAKAPEMVAKAPEVKAKAPEVKAKAPEVKAKAPQVKAKPPQHKGKPKR
jgi:cytoskeletal protein CcmA (bactofilin family)